MRQDDKQNRSTHSLHINQKTVDRVIPNKKYILPGSQSHSNPGSKNHSHIKLMGGHDSSIHQSSQLDTNSSVRIEILPQRLKGSPQKNKMKEQMPTENYIPYKNDEKMRQIFESCIDQRFRRLRGNSRPSLQSTTLLLKIDKRKDQSALNLTSHDSMAEKSNGFTINVKDLRRKNQKKLANHHMDCRIVNLFQSIQRKIKPIHQHQSGIKHSGKNSFKYSLQTLALKHISHHSGVENEAAFATASQTPSLEGKHFLSSINMTEDNPQPLLRIKRKQETQKDVKSKRILQAEKQGARRRQPCQREYELKPWSIQQIPVEL